MAKEAQWLQAGVYSAREDDQLIDWIGGGVIRAEGIGEAATQSDPLGLSIDMLPIRLIIPGTDITTQGSYLCTSDATDTVAMPAAPASGRRIDVVYAQVTDAQYGRTGDSWNWFVATGTVVTSPTATPQPPTIPSATYRTAAPVAQVLRTAGEGNVKSDAISTVVPRCGQVAYVVVSPSTPVGRLAEGTLWVQTG